MGLRSRSSQDIPVGTVWPYYGTVAPPGWLLCDGGSTSGYAALAAQIGGTTPDLRGRIPIGAGQGSGLTNRTLGGSVGSEGASLSAIGQLPAHNHGGGDHNHTTDMPEHWHAGGNAHGHNAENHVHGASHDHGTHYHGGTILTGNSWGGHAHGYGDQVGSSPQGYFTGTYAGSYNSDAGWAGFNTAGPSQWGYENPLTGWPNNVGGNPGATAGPSSEGSSTAFGTGPPTLAVQFIIKT